MQIIHSKICLFVVALLSRAVIVRGITAAELDAMVPAGDTSNCDDVSKYTIGNKDSGQNFFIDGLEESYCQPPTQSDCLFYGKGLGDSAKAIAAQTGQITIWHIWQKKYYSIENVKSNTLRCIMFNKKSRMAYFASMSASMGAVCDVYAQYLTPFPSTPDLDGFFGQYELPQMQRGGASGRLVNEVDALSSTPGGIPNTIYTRGSSSKRDENGLEVFDGAESMFNSTRFAGLRERAALFPRADCGASDDDRKALDDCAVIPW